LTNHFRRTVSLLMKCFWPTVLDPIRQTYTVTVHNIVMDSVRWRRRRPGRYASCGCRALLSGQGGAHKVRRFAAIAPTDGRREITHCRRRSYTLDSCLFCAAGWYGRRDRSPAPPRGNVSNLISSKTHLPCSDTIARVTVGKPLHGDSPSMLVPICIH